MGIVDLGGHLHCVGSWPDRLARVARQPGAWAPTTQWPSLGSTRSASHGDGRFVRFVLGLSEAARAPSLEATLFGFCCAASLIGIALLTPFLIEN